MKFDELTTRIALASGKSWVFIIAVCIVIAWGIMGPLFHFSDTWQLVINTGTTIITFLLLFLVQNTQNRDNLALHIKIDELIRSVEKARNEYRGIERRSTTELERLKDTDSHGS